MTLYGLLFSIRSLIIKRFLNWKLIIERRYNALSPFSKCLWINSNACFLFFRAIASMVLKISVSIFGLTKRAISCSLISPHKKLRFCAGLVQHRAFRPAVSLIPLLEMLWCWVSPFLKLANFLISFENRQRSLPTKLTRRSRALGVISA